MSGEKVFEGRLVSVELRDGKEVVLHGPAVAIVAIDREDRLVLVRQRRPAAREPLLELPAGNLDEGEDPEAAARRELSEETGLHGGDWTQVASFFTTPGFCDERIHLFVARGVAEGEAHPDGSEEIELVRIPVADLPARLGDFEDAKTLAGVLLYLRGDGPSSSPA